MINPKSKKSSLSLSTNAIVVFILAIAILGLSLTFARDLFSRAESKVEETFSVTELTNPPTRVTPITISPSKVVLRPGDSGKAVLAIYNNRPTARYCRLEKGFSNPSPLPEWLTILERTSESKIERGEIATWVISVSSKGTAGSLETVLQSFVVECGPDPGGTGDPQLTEDLIINIET